MLINDRPTMDSMSGDAGFTQKKAILETLS
jgi:hypothetical protein